MLVLEHWGEEWVPVFTTDRSSQRPSQEPVSDAYMSGMPSRKRRCLRQSRPSSTVEGLLDESVRDAATALEPAAESGTMRISLRTAFRERMRQLTHRRAHSTEDFRSNQFELASRYLTPEIGNTPDKSDSSSESLE